MSRWCGSGTQAKVRRRVQEDEGDGEELAYFFADGDADAHIRVRPETVFHPRKADGFHLQACQHGFEMQYWRGATLSGSFWLPERPDQQRIDWFLASVGAPARAADPAAAAVPAELAAEPWAAPETPQEWLLRNERRLALAALTVFLVVAAWQEARIWRLQWNADAAAAALAQRNDELGSTLATRADARRLRRRNVDLARLLNMPSQARLMGLVHETLPDSAAQFQEWSYSQGDLDVVLQGPDIDPVAYVQAWNGLSIKWISARRKNPATSKSACRQGCERCAGVVGANKGGVGRQAAFARRRLVHCRHRARLLPARPG